jgi:hypothetical protein
MAVNEHQGDDLAARLARCYTGVVYDVMRGLGHTDCILPPSIVPLDVGMVAAGPSSRCAVAPTRASRRTRRCCAGPSCWPARRPAMS